MARCMLAMQFALRPFIHARMYYVLCKYAALHVCLCRFALFFCFIAFNPQAWEGAQLLLPLAELNTYMAVPSGEQSEVAKMRIMCVCTICIYINMHVFLLLAVYSFPLHLHLFLFFFFTIFLQN